MPGDVHDRFFAGLSLLQADGQACVVCARRLRGRGLVWVPVGLSRTVSQVFACVGECADRAVAPVALVVGDEALSAAGVAYLAVVGAVGDDVRWINPDDVVNAVIAAVVPFVVAAELRRLAGLVRAGAVVGERWLWARAGELDPEGGSEPR